MNLEQSEFRLGKVFVGVGLQKTALSVTSSAVLLAHSHKPHVLHIQDIRVPASGEIQAAIVTPSAPTVSFYPVLFFKYLVYKLYILK